MTTTTAFRHNGRYWLPTAIIVAALTGCSEEVGGGSGGAGAGTPTGSTGSSTGDGGGGGVDISNDGEPLAVDVPADGTVYVDLDTVSVVSPTDPSTSTEWDLAFNAWDIFTNSGPSGPGEGGGFGPLSAPTFLLDIEPEHPFIIQDETGGAFLRWYAYEGSVHALWSRYHVYGVRDGNRLFKVQPLSYYGEVQGAPVSAIIQIRYAEVTESGIGPTTTLTDLDATAGGLAAPPDSPSECLDLDTGDRAMLTPEQALASSAWHLCFRRDAISVNGELGGPRGITAANLTIASLDEEETVEQAKTFTAENTLAAFEAANWTALNDAALTYRGDRVVSVFNTNWYDASVNPTVPALATWLVVGGDGQARFLLAVESFEEPSEATPGRVNLRIKAL